MLPIYFRLFLAAVPFLCTQDSQSVPVRIRFLDKICTEPGLKKERQQHEANGRRLFERCSCLESELKGRNKSSIVVKSMNLRKIAYRVAAVSGPDMCKKCHGTGFGPGLSDCQVCHGMGTKSSTDASSLGPDEYGAYCLWDGETERILRIKITKSPTGGYDLEVLRNSIYGPPPEPEMVVKWKLPETPDGEPDFTEGRGKPLKGNAFSDHFADYMTRHLEAGEHLNTDGSKSNVEELLKKFGLDKSDPSDV